MLAISGSAVDLAAAKRPKGSSASFEMHGSRHANFWPLGKPRSIGVSVRDHLGETYVAGALALTFAAKLRACDTLQDVEALALHLDDRVSDQQFAPKALQVAIARRCRELLARGWGSSLEVASDGLASMLLLRGERLLLPEPAVREATGRALAALCASEAPRSAAVAGSPGEGTALVARLQEWSAHAKLFAEAAEAGFLAPDDASLVEAALDASLRRRLEGASSQALQRSADLVHTGGASILRARAAAASGRAKSPGPLDIGISSQAWGDLPEVPSSVSAVAFKAVRAAERIEGSAKASSVVDRELHDRGLADPTRTHHPLGRRATSESILLPPRVADMARTAPGRFFAPAELVQRAGAQPRVRGHLGQDAAPSRSRVHLEVEAGVGAAGSAAWHSGLAMTGVGPARPGGMTAMQRSLLHVHARRPQVGKQTRALRP